MTWTIGKIIILLETDIEERLIVSYEFLPYGKHWKIPRKLYRLMEICARLIQGWYAVFPLEIFQHFPLGFFQSSIFRLEFVWRAFDGNFHAWLLRIKFCFDDSPMKVAAETRRVENLGYFYSFLFIKEEVWIKKKIQISIRNVLNDSENFEKIFSHGNR